METVNIIINWFEGNATILGAMGSVAATVTLFFTNGTGIMRRVLGLEKKDETTEPAAMLADGGAAPLAANLPPPDFGDQPVIALMPFRLSGEGPADGDFLHGLADDIISHLGLVPGVITLTHQNADGVSSAVDLARRSGATHIIEGSVRQQAGEVRISVHLVDNRGARIFSKRFDRTMEKPFALMDEVAEVTTESVRAVLAPRQPDPEPRPGPGSRRDHDREDGDGGWSDEDDYGPEVLSPKSRRLTLFLCLPPMGIFGMHRFYTGRPFLGILYFLTAGFFVIGTIVDFAVTLFGQFRDGKGRRLKYWRPARKRQRDEPAHDLDYGDDDYDD